MAEDRLDRLTEAALDQAGLADLRPLYRNLLLRLKGRDPEAFEEATRRYHGELVPALQSGNADPLREWLAYGRWLAQRLVPGEVVAVDPSGRARPLPPSDLPKPAELLLHLPHEDRTPALALALPREPTVPQQVTAELLAP